MQVDRRSWEQPATYEIVGYGGYRQPIVRVTLPDGRQGTAMGYSVQRAYLLAVRAARGDD